MLNLWCSLLCPAGCQSPFPQLHNPLVAGKAIACSVAQQQVCEYVCVGGGGGKEGGRRGEGTCDHMTLTAVGCVT